MHRDDAIGSSSITGTGTGQSTGDEITRSQSVTSVPLSYLIWPRLPYDSEPLDGGVHPFICQMPLSKAGNRC